MERRVLEERLSEIRTRGEVKALGRVLDSDPIARATAVQMADARGVVGAAGLDGKRLVKALLGRAEGAQRRTNPIRRDEPFVCVHCGADVPRGGARVRDHCPACLHGLHVDEVPGDRANPCGGVLKPVDLVLEGRSGVVISYRCERCGAVVRNRAHPDDALPEGLRLPGEGQT